MLETIKAAVFVFKIFQPLILYYYSYTKGTFTLRRNCQRMSLFSITLELRRLTLSSAVNYDGPTLLMKYDNITLVIRPSSLYHYVPNVLVLSLKHPFMYTLGIVRRPFETLIFGT